MEGQVDGSQAKSALNPILWLCGIVTVPALITGSFYQQLPKILCYKIRHHGGLFKCFIRFAMGLSLEARFEKYLTRS